MDSIYCKLQKENGQSFLLKMVKMHDHLAFLILEETAAYLGKATDNYLSETAAYFSMDSDTYCSDIKKYITGSTPDIKINVTAERFTINKTVRKMCVTYFSVDLQQMTYGSMAMKIAIELLNLYKDANLKSIENEDKLRQSRYSIDEYKEKLENYTKEHNNSENHLYTSFLLILNEKKRQLQFYRDLLDKAQSNHISKSPTRIVLSEDENSEEDIINDEIITNLNQKYNNYEKNDTEMSTNSCRKQIWSNSFDSDGEPIPGPSKTRNVEPPNLQKCEKAKPVEYIKKPVNSATKLNLKSKSDSNIDVHNSNPSGLSFEEEFVEELDVLPSKLPKRIKSLSNRTTVIKTSSNCSQVVQNPIKQDSPEIAEDSPSVNFTTQDLFDRM